MGSISIKPEVIYELKMSTDEHTVIAQSTFSCSKLYYFSRIFCYISLVVLLQFVIVRYFHQTIVSSVRNDYVHRQDFHLLFLQEIHQLANELHPNLDILNEKFLTLYNIREKRNAPTNSRSGGGGGYNFIKSPSDEPHVEFFNPDFKSALEAKDELIRQQTGNKGAAPGGDSWVWLTSYCRIPEKALQGYCTKINQFCPPGRQGATGPPGIQGIKGDRGDKGYPGIPGQMGPRGIPGLPGEKGVQGRTGLDGRDGIPGEPGLDGIPGRNGMDGTPGTNGIPGLAGKDGFNGTDGSPGQQGPLGPQGPPGPKGLTGPRGRPGRPGTHGTPGTPGVTAYKLKGDQHHPLLIPPSIAGIPKNSFGPIVVHEGENVRLHCSATGVPTPHITWQKMGKRPINRGAWQDLAVSGSTLHITKVHRSHMGTYLCIADNGIPPQANQTFQLEVYFPPLIRIHNQMLGVMNGSKAVLECETEAFPEPIRFWERSDGRLLESDDKYKIDNNYEKEGYKFRMQLNITNMNFQDFSYLYSCISKNELQTTKGEITVYETNHWTSSPRSETNKISIFGVEPPDKISLEDLCGPPVQCPECTDKDVKCSVSGVSLIDLISRWEIRRFGENFKYTGVSNRTTDCVLYAVGKPVYHRYSDYIYGCWMRDAFAQNVKDMEKIWITREDEPARLYQFDNKTMYRKDIPTKTFVLDQSFRGNAHVVYNGSFFYNVKDSNKIVKYDFTGETKELQLPFTYENSTSTFLYTGQYNYMDFNIDDNGLWIIFPVPKSNNTAIAKVNITAMQPEYIWNVSINHRKVGEMFVVCGVLYAVDSVTDGNTKIRFALDLYKNQLLDVNLSFTNPFRKTTMIGYDCKNKELFTWDKGNQLTYPVRYHEIGYNINGAKGGQLETVDNSVAEMHTGYDVF